MAPKDENELQHMLATAIEYPGPAAIRFPRGSGEGVALELLHGLGVFLIAAGLLARLTGRRPRVGGAVVDYMAKVREGTT